MCYCMDKQIGWHAQIFVSWVTYILPRFFNKEKFLPVIDFPFYTATMIPCSVWHSILCRINCCRALSPISLSGRSNKKPYKKSKYRHGLTVVHGLAMANTLPLAWQMERFLSGTR